MVEKLLESDNGMVIAAILGIVAALGIGEYCKTARAGMDRDYEITAGVKDCGEVTFRPSKKSDPDEEEEEVTEEEQGE